MTSETDPGGMLLGRWAVIAMLTALGVAPALAGSGLQVGSGLQADAGVNLSAAQPAAPIEGIWLTQLKSQITVAPCPEGFCGYITKIEVPDHIKVKYGDDLAAVGTNYIDQLNEDPTLRNRPILGLQILTLSATSKKNKSWDGSIYNPEDGKTYSGFLEVIDDNKVRLNGCMMMNMICKGEDWVRVPGPN